MKRWFACVLLAGVACSSVLHGSTSPSATQPSVAATPGEYVFAVIGDWGAGTEDQVAIAKTLCAVRHRIPFKDIVTVGDNFYNPDGRATASNYYTPMKCVYSYRGNRWRATWGNHDVAGDSTRTVLGAQRIYTWTSHGVEFFMLDSNNAGQASQRAWLEHALKISKARWKVAVFHAPPFSVGGVHPPDGIVRANWVPLFEKYHVSLVLSGHEHDYEHFLVHGVHYVLTGGGGAIVYGCLNADPHLLKCEATHEFVIVTVHDARMTVTAILPDGKTLDSFTLGSI